MTDPNMLYSATMLTPSEYRGHGPRRRSTPSGSHIPIMAAEILDLFQPRPGNLIVDLTLGHGGHTGRFLRDIAPEGTVLAMDLDATQAEITRSRLANEASDRPSGTLLVETGNFAGVEQAMGLHNLPGANSILADLGVSSMQIDSPERGFSYRREGPLDMRMDPSRGESARHLLDRIDPESLAQALVDFADVEDAAPMARTMLARHRADPFVTTTQLADFCLKWREGSLSPTEWKLRTGNKAWETHPAARVFQALRILVNRELASLQHLLRVAPNLLIPGGVIAILSFHSGEDRLVKTAFEQGLRIGKYSEISPEAIRAAFHERLENPRARSAKLRWARVPAFDLSIQEQ